MAYRILDVELTDEHAARVSIADQAIAVVLRYRGYPVGFQMHERPAGQAQWSAEQLALLDEDTVTRLVAHAASVELPPGPAAGNRPAVSVAICTRDRPASLERCLESLQQLAPGPDLETSERLHGAMRAGLEHETDEDVDGEDGKDGHCVRKVADGKGDRRAGRQHPDHDAAQLPLEHLH